MALTRPRYSQIYDTDYKQSVRLATTAHVGNLAITGNCTDTVDSVTVAVNDRILVKNQNDARQNGIYIVRSVGTGSNGTWERALDANANDKVTSGMTTIVTAGTNYSGTTWKLTTPDPITIGTTELTFVNPFVQATPGAAGSGTQVQYNTTGQLTGSSAFTFNDTSNVLTVSGNVVSSSGFFIGNGSQLSGIETNTILSSTSNVKVYSAGNVAVSVGGTANTAVFTSSNIHVKGSILPTANVTYDLGSPTQRWRTGYFSAATIDLGGATISANTSTGTFTLTAGSTTTTVGGPTALNTQGNISVGGNASISGNLTVGGNLTVAGDIVYLNVDNIVTQDSLIYVAEGNQYDFLDIGIIGNYTRDGFYQHGGIVRDASDRIWKFFANVEAEPTTTVDFGSATYDSILAANVLATGNVVSGGNLTVNKRLFASGSSGNPGDFLSSTGSGVAWVELSLTSLTNNTTSFALEQEWANLQVNSFQVAEFSRPYTQIETELLDITGPVTIGGNVSVTGNISATGNVIASGNISGVYVLGNGSQLTGLTQYSNANVASYLSTSNANAFIRSLGVGTSSFGNVGEIRATNYITAFYSDKRLKTNFKSIENALDKVDRLQGVLYTQNEVAEQYGYNDYSQQVGVFAQDVQIVQPEAVKPAPFDIAPDGSSISGQHYLTVQYDKLVPLLIEAIKELRAEVNQLKGQ